MMLRIWFTAQSVNYRFEIDEQLSQNLFKNDKNRGGRALERKPGAQLAAGSSQKREEDENQGSWIPLGALPWVSFESSTRLRSGPEALVTRSWKQIA